MEVCEGGAQEAESMKIVLIFSAQILKSYIISRAPHS